MNTVLCKFKCEHVTHNENGAQVKMVPVTGGSEENDLFFKYTPYGVFDVGLVSSETAGFFVPGEKYYIELRKSED
jgi:hypothetical protein